MKIDKLTLNNYEEVKLLSTKYKLNVLEKDDWENIWKEMDYCNNGYLRNYVYSESVNGPEIYSTAFRCDTFKWSR